MSHEWKGTHLWFSVGFPLWFELHWRWWPNQICKEQLSRLFCCRNHCILTELVQVLLQALAFCLWSYCFVFRVRFTMALPMKKSVMKTTKSMKAAAMKTRVMKKKAVSKIARGKLAKVVVFKGNKEGSCQKQILWSKNNFFKVAASTLLFVFLYFEPFF